jgi:hypothetical protein
MKIFNDFDTQWKQKEYDFVVNKFWEDNVIFIERSIAYWIMKWIIPIIIVWSIATFFSYIAFLLMTDYSIISWILISITVIFILAFINHLINIYLDYKFDYAIVTQRWIYTYKQIWFFNSKNKELPANKIRSIESQRFWLLWNIFWYGTIVIVTDGSMTEKDEHWSHIWWKTKITYVSKPKKITKKIMELCLTHGKL